MNPSGWPQIVLYCMGRSYSGKEYIKAYGATYVPIAPGMHLKTVRMYSPIETGGLLEYLGFQTQHDGLSSLLNNPKAIASPESREVSRVKATGKITVRL